MRYSGNGDLVIVTHRYIYDKNRSEKFYHLLNVCKFDSQHTNMSCSSTIVCVSFWWVGSGGLVWHLRAALPV